MLSTMLTFLHKYTARFKKSSYLKSVRPAFASEWPHKLNSYKLAICTLKIKIYLKFLPILQLFHSKVNSFKKCVGCWLK